MIVVRDHIVIWGHRRDDDRAYLVSEPAVRILMRV
jgi:hypothetical protein